MVTGGVTMFEFLITEPGKGGLELGVAVIKGLDLPVVMLPDHFLDRDGAGHGSFRPHGGGHRAKDEARAIPERRENRWPDFVIPKEVFKRIQMMLFLIFHMFDFRRNRMIAKDGKLAFVNASCPDFAGMVNPKNSINLAFLDIRHGMFSFPVVSCPQNGQAVRQWR